MVNRSAFQGRFWEWFFLQEEWRRQSVDTIIFNHLWQEHVEELDGGA